MEESSELSELSSEDRSKISIGDKNDKFTLFIPDLRLRKGCRKPGQECSMAGGRSHLVPRVAVAMLLSGRWWDRLMWWDWGWCGVLSHRALRDGFGRAGGSWPPPAHS